MRPYRHGDRLSQRPDFHAPDQPVGRSHSHAANHVISGMLGDFQSKIDLFIRILDLYRVVKLRDLVLRETDVYYRPDHLNYLSVFHNLSFQCFRRGYDLDDLFSYRRLAHLVAGQDQVFP